jgi:hypothetical protein
MSFKSGDSISSQNVDKISSQNVDKISSQNADIILSKRWGPNFIQKGRYKMLYGTYIHDKKQYLQTCKMP